MQLGGIGDHHSSGMHQVTKCLHGNEQSLEGKMKIQVQPGAATQQTLRVHQEQPAQLSIFDWMQRLLRSTGQRWLGFWRGSDSGVLGQSDEKAGGSQTVAHMNSANDTGVANGAHHAAQAQLLQQNPYFSAVTADSKTVHPSLGQRIKIKCKKVAGQLADHLPGRSLRFSFEKQSSFQAKKNETKEDLRKRSKYRKDTVEIDCVLTDDSYLLDSYDRKGEYTQLTTKK